MDYHIFQWIHNAAGKNSFLDSIMSFASEWGIYVFIGAIILLLFIPSKQNVGIYGVISLATGLIINRLIKLLVDRPRPFVTHEVDILIPKDPSPSFPSDQALIAGVFLAVFWMLKGAFRWLGVALALVVVLSRVYVGHHYPSDVFVGVILGIVVFLIVITIKNKWKK